MSPTVRIPSDQTGKALLENPHIPQEAEVTLQRLSLRNRDFAYLGSLTEDINSLKFTKPWKLPFILNQPHSVPSRMAVILSETFTMI